MSRSSINSSKTEEAVERLSQIGHSSGWEELADKADLYKNNLSFDRYYGYDYNDDQILEIKKLFANYLLGDVYADEYEYDKPLDYDLNSLQETFESYGATKTEELTWDYKSIAFDNADSKFSIKIITDRKGNIKRVCPGGSLFWDKEYYANFDDDADDAAKKAAEYLYEGIHDKGLTDVFTHESGGAINFLLTDIEKAQIISSLRALSQEDIEKMFEEATDLSFWYYLQLEDKTVMLDFVPGSVSIGDIQANEFYNATLFPDIVFYDETSSGTSTKYDDLNDFVSFPGDMLFGEVASPLSEDEAKDILFGDYPDTTVSVASNDAEAQDYEEINPEENFLRGDSQKAWESFVEGKPMQTYGGILLKKVGDDYVIKESDHGVRYSDPDGNEFMSYGQEYKVAHGAIIGVVTGYDIQYDVYEEGSAVYQRKDYDFYESIDMLLNDAYWGISDGNDGYETGTLMFDLDGTKDLSPDSPILTIDTQGNVVRIDDAYMN